MLNRKVVKNFLEEELSEIKIPNNININRLVEKFCQYTENDYYQWLKDNFNSFFEPGIDGIDWDNI